MVAITSLSPVAQRARPEVVRPAPRVADLNGKTIGLYWNLKAGGDVALERIGRELMRRFDGLRCVAFSGSVGARPTMSPDDAKRIRGECDAIVGAVADTGGSTSWLARDMIRIEALGVPSVTVVARGMLDDWMRSADAFGQPLLRHVVIERGLASMTSDDIEALAAAVVDDVIHGLTASAADARETGGASARPADDLRVDADDVWTALERFNAAVLDAGWGDGFPVMPATHRAVEKMTAGARRPESDVIAVLEPDMGIATVHAIAVNAVMAGARPEHMPVLIAAVEAVADPHFMLRDATASTGIRALMLVVNGPIRQRIGLNSATNAMGPGAPSWVNSVIGRAMRLIYMNIGGAYSGQFDVGTTGLATKYSLCVGENEEASPWEPYHVELGFARDTSTVTVKTVFGATEIHIRKEREPEAIVDMAAAAAAGVGAHIGWVTGGTGDPDKGIEVMPQSMWLICPEHGQYLAQQGWSKARIRRYLYERARVEVRRILARYEVVRDEHGNWMRNSHLQWLEQHPDLLVPVVSRPDDFRLAVVGGPGPRSVWFWGNEEAVTRPIAD